LKSANELVNCKRPELFVKASETQTKLHSYIRSYLVRVYLVFLFLVGMVYMSTLAAEDWTQFGGPNRNFSLASSDLGTTVTRSLGDSGKYHFKGEMPHRW